MEHLSPEAEMAVLIFGVKRVGEKIRLDILMIKRRLQPLIFLPMETYLLMHQDMIGRRDYMDNHK